jgi:holliday junction DNA helicase RuvA
MIGYIKGDIIETGDDHVILNVHGLGYEVHCSEQVMLSLHGEAKAEFWVHTHVREDQLTLFGFLSKGEKQLFLSLLKVNGIGPKVAMKVLGAAPMNTITQMIENSDVRGLSQLPKVGKKTAEQIILELKGKLVIVADVERKAAFGARSDIVSALVNLGFKLNEVEQVVNEMAPDTDLQSGVRTGLQHLTSV